MQNETFTNFHDFFDCFVSCSEQGDISIAPKLKSSPGNEIAKVAEGTGPQDELYNILRSVGRLALDGDFKDDVYKGVAKKFDGDYNVLVSDLLKNSSLFGDEQSNVQASVRQAVAVGRYHPQIYIPYFDELQMRNCTSSKNEPVIFIVWNGVETETDTYPGYIMNENGHLEKLDFLISEEYAKENEVWCLSFNERINITNAIGKNDTAEVRASNDDDAKLLGRCDGCREMVERIRIPDYGDIEGWPAGDLELQLTAATALTKVFEGVIELDKDLLDEGQWTNLFHWLFYWYEEQHGIYLTTHWVEVDDGGTPGKRTLTVPPSNGLPGVSYSYPYGGNDEDLGEQIVQFPDPGYTIYNTLSIQWEMNSGGLLD